MNPDLATALTNVTTLYLTTYNRQGKSGTVPIWFFLYQGVITFCSRRDSLKVRRMQQTGRATIHLGKRTGPSVDCLVRLLDADPELQRRLLRVYRRRYCLWWLLIGPRIRRSFQRGDEILIQLLPVDSAQSCPLEGGSSLLEG